MGLLTSVENAFTSLENDIARAFGKHHDTGAMENKESCHAAFIALDWPCSADEKKRLAFFACDSTPYSQKAAQALHELAQCEIKHYDAHLICNHKGTFPEKGKPCYDLLQQLKNHT